MTEEREFAFTDRHFTTIRGLVEKHTGITLADAKRQMVYSRLARRIRSLGLKDFGTYCELIEQDDEEELTHFVNAVTTNLTAFFREAHHFRYLQELFSQRVEGRDSNRKARIWSAGCSTGEEPYSIAMELKEILPQGWDAKILATDLDSSVVEAARRGIYSKERVEGISGSRLKRWFLKGKNGSDGKVRVRRELRDMIAFRQLNLMHEWPFKGPFDAIFCRNVLIYFNKDTQRKLVDRYADFLIPNGHLFLGHSESLFKVSNRFELIGNTIYTRVS